MNAAHHAHPVHRADIDGLRAVAVLSVILFHIDPDWLPGGFVGVDIFFVISGYLITGQVVDQLGRGSFSLSEFYRRRIRRIVPAMLAVTLATIVIGAALLRPADVDALAKSAVWTVASMANVYFWREAVADYFAPSSQQIPLLHMWSLGVEEQFYLAWPLVLMLVWHKVHGASRLRVAAWLALASVLGGALLAELLLPYAERFVYYMLPTRAGELGMGAALAIWSRRGPPPRLASILRGLSPAYLAWSGALLLAASFFWLSERMPFPGWRALVPTLGAALLLAAGERGGSHGLSPLLTCRPARWLGAISYSAYLWHWPVLAFLRYGRPTLQPIDQLTAFITTLLLAWASYRWIEQPVRQADLRQRWPHFAGAATLVAGLGVLIVYGPRYGLDWERPEHRQAMAEIAQAEWQIQQMQIRHHDQTTCQRWTITPALLEHEACVLGRLQAGAPRVLLLGDSNAAHFTNMLDLVARRTGYAFRYVSIGGCPPLLGDPLLPSVATQPDNCAQSLHDVTAVLKQYPTIVLAASWPSYSERSSHFFEAVERVLQRLVVEGHRVVVLGKAADRLSYDPLCEQKAVKMWWLACSAASEPVSRRVAEANASLARLLGRLPQVGYLDVNDYLCPNDRCSATTASGVSRYKDPGHLSVAGSIELGHALLAHGIPAVLSLRSAAATTTVAPAGAP